MNKNLIPAALLASLTFATPASAQGLFGGLREKLETQAERAAEDMIGKLGESTAQGGSTGSAGVSAGGGSYERYGDFWEFRVEEVLQGPDGHWQAVIGVRAAAAHRIGLVASELKAYLITADGEALQNWGELYKASVTGPSLGLETLPGTLWMEPGDEARVRLRWDRSRQVQPVKIRLQSTGAAGESRTFPVN